MYERIEGYEGFAPVCSLHRITGMIVRPVLRVIGMLLYL